MRTATATLSPAATETATQQSLQQVLLRRRAVVHLDSTALGDTDPADTDLASTDLASTGRLRADRDEFAAAAGHSAAGVNALETDLLTRGFQLALPLRQALLALPAVELTVAGSALLADVDDLIGGAALHRPLFTGFPHNIPADTDRLRADRILTILAQRSEQPCVLCGQEGTVRALNPCAHLACTSCFEPAATSACPISGQHLSPEQLTLDLTAPRSRRRPETLPARLRTLTLGVDLERDITAELTGLLSRTAALSPQDLDDLRVLLATRSHDELSWLTETIPGRQVKAIVAAWLLHAPAGSDAATRATALLNTATDVLRTIQALSGGDASLLVAVRVAALSRPMRRALLDALDRLELSLLCEDMLRHRNAWVAAGHRLHPHEHTVRFPRAAVGFAVVRGTDLTAHPHGELLRRTARDIDDLVERDDRLVFVGAASRIEQALAAGDVEQALQALRSRPGELLRRLDHLLRLADASQSAAVLAALPAAARRVAPAVLLSTLAAVRGRGALARRRVFFPKGASATAYIIDENRGVLPLPIIDAAVAVLTEEVLRRTAALPAAQIALVDRQSDTLLVPFAERTASRAMVTLPRGSALPLPEGAVLRLFTHWMQTPEQRVDLDLSVALYDSDWNHIGQCDYTCLHARINGTISQAAVHSGDFTDAPAPHGASEFLDLNLAALAAQGVRYVVASLLSYNDVPFEQMAQVYAGVMALDTDRRDATAGAPFDPAAVELKFDLTGPGKVSVPLLLDLSQRTLRWLDVNARATGTAHAVSRYCDMIGVLADTLHESFGRGSRVRLGELALWHAAGRAPVVLVRDGDARVARYVRREGETLMQFAARLADPAAADERDVELPPVDLAVVLRADVPLSAGAQVCALYPGAVDAAACELVGAADLAAQLAPAD